MKTQDILLVEDNPGDVELTKRALEEANIRSELIVARNGKEALDYLSRIREPTEEETHTMPAIVLLDLKLPGGIPGLEVLRRIRTDNRTKLLPVIVLTSSKEEEDIAHSYELGANGYLRKPVDFDNFVETIKALGIYWVLWNVAPPVG